MPRSKKDIADESIQGTNDSSIASKRSVERLYSQPGDIEFFKHFVPKPQRRSPVINRGYWTRMQAMNFNIKNFANSGFNGKKVVVNLGCGFDPYAFQYLNDNHDQELVFLDVDYPELMKKKTEMILKTEDLRAILGNIGQPRENLHLNSEKYYAVSCDLRDLKKFSSILDSLFPLEQTSFLFTAEVSLTYMLQKCADDLIEWAVTLPDAHFSLLEQMMPSGESHPFAKRMLKHFKSYGSPLNCIESYPTLQDQIGRFEKRGWNVRSAKDLYRFWKEDVTEAEKEFVESVEQFDEWEEFMLFGQHYFVIHAVNKTDRASGQPPIDIQTSNHLATTATESARVTPHDNKLQVKLAAGTEFNGQFVSLGGMFMSRGSNLVDVDNTIVSETPFKPRVCHTVTQLSTGELMVVGGREGPAKLLSDCWLLNKNGEWEETHSLPFPRYRHCAAALSDGRLLVFGGNRASDKSFAIWSPQSGWTELSSELEPRFSSSLAWKNDETNSGVLIGGMTNKHVQCDAWQVKITDNNTIQTTRIVHEHPLLERYSAQAVFHNNTILVVGGVSEHGLFNKSTSLVRLSGTTVTPVEINQQPLWCSFSMHKHTTFGGGAACYGFGSHWDCMYSIEIN